MLQPFATDEPPNRTTLMGRRSLFERMFRKVLIANRGEIAIRVARACREMGIHTVGVYSTADREALYRRHLDESVEIGPAPAADSYLNVDRILAAAKAAGAEA